MAVISKSRMRMKAQLYVTAKMEKVKKFLGN
jgi:hypothetical protein